MKDPISTATLITVAVLETIIETMRVEQRMTENLPSFITWNGWHYVPLLLLTFVGLLWLWRLWRPKIQKLKYPHLTNPSVHFPTPDWHDPLIPFVNKTYRNEVVELDGKGFTDCTFENVTFRYNGTKPVGMTHCTRPANEHSYIFQTDNPIVMNMHEIITWLKVTGGEQGTYTRNLIKRDGG